MDDKSVLIGGIDTYKQAPIVTAQYSARVDKFLSGLHVATASTGAKPDSLRKHQQTCQAGLAVERRTIRRR